MKNLLIFVLLIGLAPSFVGAISLTEDECATLSSISGLSGASIKVNTLTHANGYVGCTAIKTDPVTALGFGLGMEIAGIDEEQNVFEVFKTSARASIASFSNLFCFAGSVTACTENSLLDDGQNFIHVTGTSNPTKGSFGTSVFAVVEHRGYIISLRLSESAPSSAFANQVEYTQVLDVARKIIDARLGGGATVAPISSGPTVDSVIGEVEVIHKDGSTQVLKKGDRVGSDDRIYTALDSSVRIKFADGHIALVRELSDVTLTSLNADANSIETRLWLAAGNISVEAGLSDTVKSDFEIRTPTATCSVRGTIFQVAYNAQDKETLLQVQEGSVEITSESASELVVGGQEALVVENGAINLSAFSGSIDTGTKGFSIWINLAFVVLAVILFLGGRKMHRK